MNDNPYNGYNLGNVQAQFGGNVSIVYDLTGKGPLQSCIDCLELGGIYISMERLWELFTMKTTIVELVTNDNFPEKRHWSRSTMLIM